MIADFKKPMPGATILAGLIALVFAVALLTDRKATAAPEAAALGKAEAPKNDPNAAQAAPTPAPAPRGGLVDAPHAERANAQDAAILDRTMPEVHFNAVALADVVDFLRDVTGANISVDWKALAASGVEKTATVTVRMRNVKVSTALKAILKDAGGDNVKLGFEIDEGILVISTAEELYKNTEARVYDVRDLLMIKDDKVNETTLKELTEVIEQTIDPTTWTAAGGSIGTIKHLNGQLVITQTRENQKQVVLLLEKIREASGLQISVRSHLIKVSPAILKDMEIFIPTDSPVIGRGDHPKQSGKVLKPVQGQMLDDEQVEKLLKAVQAVPDSTTLFAPRITLFNGQRGSISMGEEIPHIAGWTALNDGKREPQMAHVKTGFIFNLQAFISADRKYVTVNMQPRIVKLRKMDQVPWPQAQADEKLTIQKPDLAVQEIDTMVSIPDGGTLLTMLGDNEEKGKDAKGFVNILLVRPTIVIPRQAEQPQFPLLEKHPQQ